MIWSPNWSAGEIRKNYFKAAKLCHPDLHPTEPQAAEKFRRLNAEYQNYLARFNKPPSNSATDTDFKPTIRYFVNINLILNLADVINGCERSLFIEEEYLSLEFPRGTKTGKIVFGPVKLKKSGKITTINVTVTDIELPEKYQIIHGKLTYHCHVSKLRAKFGGEHVFEGPDNDLIKIDIPKNLKNKSQFALVGAGLYNKQTKTREKLYIKFIVSLFG